MLLVVAVALIDADGRVLLSRRPEGKPMAGLWEFPGGKVEASETPEAALIRELAEELGIDVSESCLAPFTFASHGYDDFHLRIPLYVCRVWDGIVRPRAGQQTKWVRPISCSDYELTDPAKRADALLRRRWLEEVALRLCAVGKPLPENAGGTDADLRLADVGAAAQRI